MYENGKAEKMTPDFFFLEFQGVLRGKQDP